MHRKSRDEVVLETSLILCLQVTHLMSNMFFILRF